MDNQEKYSKIKNASQKQKKKLCGKVWMREENSMKRRQKSYSLEKISHCRHSYCFLIGIPVY
jgi:hypothetical protein